jgi:hypothetical protein
MEGKSYLEILAENDAEARQEFEPNAKDLLIQHNEYEYTVEAHDHHPDELENQDDFKKPIGSYHASAEGTEAAPYKNSTKLSVTYNSKDVTTHVFNIDSKFRSDMTQPSTNYTYKFNHPLKNIISMKISSLEIPNTSYSFSCDLYHNVAFNVTCVALKPVFQRIKLEDGNYEDSFTFAAILQERFDEVFGENTFTVILNATSAKLTITNIAGNPFSLDFTEPGPTSNLILTTDYIRPYQNGIGYHMGFKNITYSGKSTYTGENLVNTVENHYFFLSLGPDYPIIKHKSFNSQKAAFAKIRVNVPKYSVIFDDGSNITTKEYFFRQPSNVTTLQVILFDAYEQVIDLNGIDFSFTVELVEVINQSLHDEIRDN